MALNAFGHAVWPMDHTKSRMIHTAPLGLTELRWRPLVVVQESVLACLTFWGGRGLIRRRAYGWWLLMGCVLFQGIPETFANLGFLPGWCTGLALVIGGATVMWGVFRIPIYEPFASMFGKDGHTP